MFFLDFYLKNFLFMLYTSLFLFYSSFIVTINDKRFILKFRLKPYRTYVGFFANLFYNCLRPAAFSRYFSEFGKYKVSKIASRQNCFFNLEKTKKVLLDNCCCDTVNKRFIKLELKILCSRIKRLFQLFLNC